MYLSFSDFYNKFSGDRKNDLEVSLSQKIFSSWEDINFQNLILNANSDLEIFWKINQSSNLKITQKNGSKLKIICLTEPNSKIDFDLEIDCLESNTETEIYFLGKFLTHEAIFNYTISFNHLATNQKSKLMMRNVLAKGATVKAFGNIKISPEGKQTDTHLEIKNLMLDDLSTILSQPNLRIQTDEVKATHGLANFGLENEQSFFLKTRGFSNNQIEDILVQAFCKTILDQVPLICL
jgi:Fe-S cluster assembly protein SufD